MKAAIRRIGNSQGIILPKPLLSQLDLSGEVELKVEDDAIVLRKPRKRVRKGWAEASKRLAALDERRAVWPAFPNRADAKLKW
jgi:antitoxin MazE